MRGSTRASMENLKSCRPALAPSAQRNERRSYARIAQVVRAIPSMAGQPMIRGFLAPLERSEHMTDVHFFAPTARGPDGKLFRFSIEARVEPRIKVGED